MNFINHSEHQLDVSVSVLSNFLRFVAIGGDFEIETANYLSKLAYDNQVAALTQIIRHLIARSCVHPCVIEARADFETSCPTGPRSINS